MNNVNWNETIAFPDEASGETIIRVGINYVSLDRINAPMLRALHDQTAHLNRQETSFIISQFVPDAYVKDVTENLFQLASEQEKKSVINLIKISLLKPSNEFLGRAAGILFSPMVIILYVVLSLFGLSLIRLKPIAVLDLLNLDGIQFLWAPFLLTLLFHEFGHMVFAAKHNIKIREVGVALIYFRPALYVNMSEAWMASREARILTSLGGIVFQIFPLSIAAIASYFSDFRYLNAYILLNCISIVINLLPFAKTDGYWLLVHTTRITNLRQKCFQQLYSLLSPRSATPVWKTHKAALAIVFSLGCIFYSGILYLSPVIAIYSFGDNMTRSSLYLICFSFFMITYTMRRMKR